jgi:hypothetical protein
LLLPALLFVQLHPDAEDLIRSLLVLDPQQRLGSAGVHQIQRHPFFASIPWGSLEAEVMRDQQQYEEMRTQQLQEEPAGGSSTGSYSSYEGGNGNGEHGYSLMTEQERFGAAAAERTESPASRW